MATEARHLSFWMLYKNMLSKFYFVSVILCSLGCLVEGRPKTVKKCGISELPMARIIGGDLTSQGDYPWMVTVREKNYSFSHICGGTILNEYWILTAAHCIDYPKKPWRYEIYVGLHRLSKTYKKSVKKHKIFKIIMHEDYDSETFLNDIALLRTKEPIDFKGSGGYVNGICLPDSARDPTGLAIVTGWGYTMEDGENSDILRAVKVPIVPRKKCDEAYDEDDIGDTQICAGTVNKDSCQSDSGGPLVQKNRKGAYILIGIVSYGSGCGNQDYPGIYTKVASFMDWMDKNMN